VVSGGAVNGYSEPTLDLDALLAWAQDLAIARRLLTAASGRLQGPTKSAFLLSGGESYWVERWSNEEPEVRHFALEAT
jgi:hypothetical protein